MAATGCKHRPALIEEPQKKNTIFTILLQKKSRLFARCQVNFINLSEKNYYIIHVYLHCLVTEAVLIYCIYPFLTNNT